MTVEFKMSAMSAYGKSSSQLKFFNCYELFTIIYKCTKCKYATSQKKFQLHHICKIVKAKSEVMFQQCVWCNVASYSFIWHYFHERRCTFIRTNSELTSILTKSLKQMDDQQIKSDQCRFFITFTLQCIYVLI